MTALGQPWRRTRIPDVFAQYLEWRRMEEHVISIHDFGRLWKLYLNVLLCYTILYEIFQYFSKSVIKAKVIIISADSQKHVVRLCSSNFYNAIWAGCHHSYVLNKMLQLIDSPTSHHRQHSYALFAYLLHTQCQSMRCIRDRCRCLCVHIIPVQHKSTLGTHLGTLRLIGRII